MSHLADDARVLIEVGFYPSDSEFTSMGCVGGVGYGWGVVVTGGVLILPHVQRVAAPPPGSDLVREMEFPVVEAPPRC